MKKIVCILALCFCTAGIAIAQQGENVDLVGWLREGPANAVAVEGDYAYVGAGATLLVVDVTDPLNPIRMGRVDLSGVPAQGKSIVAQNPYVYVATGEYGVRVIDVSDKNAPREVADIPTPGYANGVAVSGDYAYIAAGSEGACVADISTPTNPQIIRCVDTPGDARAVAISDGYILVADYRSGLRIIDVSDIDPNNWQEVGGIDTPGYARSVVVSGNYAYVADYYGGLRAIDISDKTTPQEVDSVDLADYARDVAIQGNNAFVIGGNGLFVVDISQPNALREVRYADINNSTYSIALSGGYAYVAADSSGLIVFDITDSAEATMSFINTPGYACGVKLSDGYAIVADGSRGIQVVDVSNPLAPQIVGMLDTPGYADDVAVSGDYAYVADDDSGLRVIDISDKTAPEEVGSVEDLGRARKVVISDDYAIVSNDSWNGTLYVIDIIDPTNPQVVGNLNFERRIYDLAVNGTTVYVANYEKGLRLVDISNPSQPRIIGGTALPGYSYSVAVGDDYVLVGTREDGVYVLDVTGCTIISSVVDIGDLYYRGAITIYGDYAFVSRGSYGVSVLDMSDPTAPQVLCNVDTPGSAYDVAVDNDYAYVADGNGLRIVDMSNLPACGFDIQMVSSVATKDITVDVAPGEDYAFTANLFSGFQVVDVTNPQAPQEVSLHTDISYVTGVAVEGDYAYAVGDNRLVIYDVSAPGQEIQIASYALGDEENSPRGVKYEILDQAGITDVGDIRDDRNIESQDFGAIEPESVDGTSDLSVSGAYDIVVRDGYAFIASGSLGLRVIDVRDPYNPRDLVKKFRLPDSIARDIAISGDYAYIAGRSPGMLCIINIKNPGAPQIIASIPTVDTSGEQVNAYGVAAWGNHVFVASYAGLHVFDVSGPDELQQISIVEGFHAESVTVRGFSVFVAERDGLQIFDVSDPTALQMAGYYHTLDQAYDVRLGGNLIYLASGRAGLMILESPLVPTIAPVSIKSVTPGCCSIEGGAMLTITGDGFMPGAKVFIGQEAAMQVNVLSSIHMTIVTPPGELGVYAITVINPDGGASTLPKAFIYTPPVRNVITSLDFEGEQLDEYWTLENTNPGGAIAELGQEQSHSGKQAFHLNAFDAVGDTVLLSHTYEATAAAQFAPVRGEFSIWYYDNGNYDANLNTSGTGSQFFVEGSNGASLAISKNSHYVPGFYAAKKKNTDGTTENLASTVELRMGWHEFKIRVDDDGATWFVDGEEQAQIHSELTDVIQVGVIYDGAQFKPDDWWDDFVHVEPGVKCMAGNVGDVSGDGNVTAYDASLILQFVVGLIDKLPVNALSATQAPDIITPRHYELSLPNLSALVGTRVNVPIQIDDATGLQAGGIVLNYDSKVLHAIRVFSTPMLSGSYWKSNVEETGEVRMAFASGQPLVGNGALFSVEFEVMPTLYQEEISLHLAQAQFGEQHTVTMRNGSIQIVPRRTELLSNYPNPFNPETWIPYLLAKDALVRVSIYDVRGRQIRNIDLGYQNAGAYVSKGRAVYWDGRNKLGEKVSSGVYFYTLHAGEFTKTRRMLVVK